MLYVAESLDLLGEYCSEFLIHAADVEGLCQGIDEDLVRSESIFHIVATSADGELHRPRKVGPHTHNLRRRRKR